MTQNERKKPVQVTNLLLLKKKDTLHSSFLDWSHCYNVVCWFVWRDRQPVMIITRHVSSDVYLVSIQLDGSDPLLYPCLSRSRWASQDSISLRYRDFLSILFWVPSRWVRGIGDSVYQLPVVFFRLVLSVIFTLLGSYIYVYFVENLEIKYFSIS